MTEKTHDYSKASLLLKVVLEQFGKTLDSPSDYDSLSLDIQARTGEAVSSTTLKRLYGYVKPATAPRLSTLSTLARYAGYAGWSDFCKRYSPDTDKQHDQAQLPADNIDNPTEGNKMNRQKKLATVILAVAAFCFAIVITILAVSLHHSPNPNEDLPRYSTRDTLIVISDSDTTIISLRDSLQSAYDIILDECMDEAKRQAGHVLEKYDEMDIISYYDYVYKEYIRIVFTDIRNLVEAKSSEMIADENIREKILSRIFAECRDYCSRVLMQDFPKKELQETYKKLTESE